MPSAIIQLWTENTNNINRKIVKSIIGHIGSRFFSALLNFTGALNKVSHPQLMCKVKSVVKITHCCRENYSLAKEYKQRSDIGNVTSGVNVLRRQKYNATRIIY